MADIIASKLVLDDGNALVLRDADAQEQITSLKEDFIDSLITDTASGSIASFPDGADGVPVKSMTVNIEPVQEGSGDPSPDNVRPISGHTSAVVMRTGKNLLPDSEYTTNATGATSHIVNATGKIPKGTIITASGDADGTALDYSTCQIQWRIGSTMVAAISPNASKTFADDVVYNNLLYYTTGALAGKNVKLQAELGSTASTYEPYQGQTVTIDLDGTRYGGTLNLDTGTLTDNPRWFATVDRQIVDLGTLNWTYSERYFYATTPYPVPVYNAYSAYANAICSAYRVEKFGTMYNNYSTVDKCFSINNGSPNDNVVRIRDTAYADATSFKTAMNGVQLVYELATPFTVQLTANDDITTVLGQNNIWADAGTVDVEYRADTKLYIQKVMSS